MNQKEQITKSPWILCQSKSIPGKFYYFNVVTGVQAWCEDFDKIKDAHQAQKMYEASQFKSLAQQHRPCTSNTPSKSHPTLGLHEKTDSLRQPIFAYSPPRQVPSANTFKQREAATDIEASAYAQAADRDRTQMSSANSHRGPLRRQQSSDMSTGCAQAPRRSNIQVARRHSTALDLAYFDDKREVYDNRNHSENESCHEATTNLHATEFDEGNAKRDVYTIKLTVDNRAREQNESAENDRRERKGNPVNCNSQEMPVPSYYKPAPLFGQSIFRNYIANGPPGNILWAPIPVQTMYIQDSPPSIKPVVEASGIPLSQRFANTVTCNRTLSRADVFRKQCQTESKLDDKPTDSSPYVRRSKARFSSESDSKDYLLQPVSRTNLSASKESGSGNGSNLGVDDLRHVLMSKRKRKNELQHDSGGSEGKKIKTYKGDVPNEYKSKKKVTFLLGDAEHDDESSDYDYASLQEAAEDPTPRQQAAVWYVLVDGNTLTEEFVEIDKFVQSDSNCRLLITRRLRADVEAMCFGDCRGQKGVIFARKITRLFLAPPSHYVCLDDVNNIRHVDDSSDVITCCIQLLCKGHVFILVTNDPKLILEAKMFKINCLKTCELSAFINKPNAEVTFALRKLQKPTQNEVDRRFDCDDDYIPLYTLSSKHNLSSEEKNHQNDKAETLKVDAYTSPVSIFTYDDNAPKETQSKTNVKKNTNQSAGVVKEPSQDGGRVTDSIFDITIEKDKTQDDYNTNSLRSGEIKSSVCDNSQSRSETDNRSCSIFEGRRSIFEIEDGGTNETSNLHDTDTSIAPQITESKNEAASSEKAAFERDCMLKYRLQKYAVKSEVMYQRIRNEFEELACSFQQIVEDALAQVLQKHNVFITNTTHREILKESMLKVEELYFGDELKYVTNKLFSFYECEVDDKGKLNPLMKPDDFIQMFACAVIFIRELKKKIPSYQQLLDADTVLEDILERLENPQEDVERPLETSSVDRSGMDLELKDKPRQNFVKNRSEIIRYLKAHFEAWKYSTEDSQPNEARNEVKIFRTIGRNLGLLKLDHRSITVNDPAQHAGNTDAADEKGVATVKNNSRDKEVYNLNAVDYEGSRSNITAVSSELNSNGRCSEASDGTASFVYDIKSAKAARSANVTITSNVKVAEDGSEADSGIGNATDGAQAHALVKMFLCHISAALKAIHRFINMSVTQLKGNEVEEDHVSVLRNTANTLHHSITCIIDRLTSIIQRETDERTSLKKFLLKAGLEASTDKKITRYRQVVTKCLEQASILKNALKTILDITEDDCQLSLSSNTMDSGLRYFNIFE